MHKAAAGGFPVIVDLLIRNGADVNLKDDSGETAIFSAAERGERRIVQFLVEAKAKITDKDGKGRSLLELAVFRKDKAMAQLLISLGAEIDCEPRWVKRSYGDLMKTT